ncbi:hypothetical protein CEXT_602561 [Caerostris extrusa]|uniref:Maturase K n=1 Tax=Caerostris extrusa TaxID=172846 RepID=A0AAV4SC71_CAEEX|nr:hypothetical protein CEXT_602561 [Caerostris extrusa]
MWMERGPRYALFRKTVISEDPSFKKLLSHGKTQELQLPFQTSSAAIVLAPCRTIKQDFYSSFVLLYKTWVQGGLLMEGKGLVHENQKERCRQSLRPFETSLKMVEICVYSFRRSPLSIEDLEGDLGLLLQRWDWLIFDEVVW